MDFNLTSLGIVLLIVDAGRKNGIELLVVVCRFMMEEIKVGNIPYRCKFNGSAKGTVPPVYLPCSFWICILAVKNKNISILKIEVSFARIETNFKLQGINCYASRVPLAAWTASVLFL